MKSGVRRGLGSLAAVPMLIGVVVAINLLALFFFVRYDLTDSKLFSLSEASEQLAASLDDPVIVRLYFTEELPPPYNANARYLKDQLYEYRAYSGGKLRFEFIDPIKSDREEEAMKMGVPAVQVNAVEKDKIEVKKVYMGLAFLYEDKREVIPVVQSTENLEYEISSAIRKVTTDVLPTIGFLTGHGEQSIYENLQSARQRLEQLYTVRAISITSGEMIDDDVSTLIVAGPTDSVSLWDQYAIDQYIMRGGKVAFLYDPVDVQIQQQIASNRNTNWLEFLNKYGIGIEQDLVTDQMCSQIAVMQKQGFIQFQSLIDYPYIPQIFTFNPDNLIGKNLKGVHMPFVSSLDSTAAESTGVVFEPICWTSEKSGIRRAPYYVAAQQEFYDAEFDQPPQILAAALKGTFSTAFPAGPPLTDQGNHPNLTEAVSSSPLTRMVVVGDADFCTDPAMRSSSNIAFFMNIADWLTQDERLITIRSREVISRPLEEISDGKRRAVKLANVFGPPLLVVLLGMWRWQSRRRKKAM